MGLGAAISGFGDKEAGDGGGGVVDGIDGVEAATTYGVGREGEEGRTRSFGGQDWLREKAGGRVEAGEIDSPWRRLSRCRCRRIRRRRAAGGGVSLRKGARKDWAARKARCGGERGEGEKKSATGERWR